MKSPTLSTSAAVALLLAGAPSAFSASLLSPTDAIIAVDIDLTVPASNYPAAENPNNIRDITATTKYLNFGVAGTGFIVTPSAGPVAVQSLRLTTANDSSTRDPRSYVLYGTNDPITSADNSQGLAENWTLVSGGSSGLPGVPGANDNRLTPGAVQSFANGTAYSSYKMVFTSIWGNTGAMQVGDVEFFTGAGGGGTSVITTTSSVLAIDTVVSQSNTLFVEPVQDAINGNSHDGTVRKYLNFGKENSGFIVDPGSASSIVNGIEIWTANDQAVRDPASFAIYGSTGPILSLDNSTGEAENWTLIASDVISLPAGRNVGPADNFSSGLVSFANSTAYDLYKVVFPTLKDGTAANSMQIGDLQLYGTVVPEPSIGLLALAGGAMLLRRRRTR